MLKLELDWAGDEAPPTGVDGEDELVRVELVSERGPAGWPVIAVYVAHEEGTPAYTDAMRLDGWLQGVYGADEDEAQELGGMAVEV